ncbi:hypothetical protein [Methyloglobulus sp.]|uniref:hypothetical protein n=1 Tax=Methyloglobulus sp. TaxID=2518622 RepID=UPI0032B71B9D
MFYAKFRQATLLSLLTIFAAIGLSAPIAYAEVQLPKITPKYPGCHNFGKLAVPLDFIAYLEETKLDDLGLMDAHDSFRPTHSNPQNTEWMATIPDLQDRLEIWRIATKRSDNGSSDECSPSQYLKTHITPTAFSRCGYKTHQTTAFIVTEYFS